MIKNKDSKKSFVLDIAGDNGKGKKNIHLLQ
jgi:hypothetical protein